MILMFLNLCSRIKNGGEHTKGAIKAPSEEQNWKHIISYQECTTDAETGNLIPDTCKYVGELFHQVRVRLWNQITGFIAGLYHLPAV